MTVRQHDTNQSDSDIISDTDSLILTAVRTLLILLKQLLAHKLKDFFFNLISYVHVSIVNESERKKLQRTAFRCHFSNMVVRAANIRGGKVEFQKDHSKINKITYFQNSRTTFR